MNPSTTVKVPNLKRHRGFPMMRCLGSGDAIETPRVEGNHEGKGRKRVTRTSRIETLRNSTVLYRQASAVGD